MSEEFGNKKMENVYKIRDKMNKLTDAKFEVEQPPEGSTPFGKQLRWHIMCPYIEQVDRMYHANSIWQYPDGRICTESMPLGSFFEWVERDYGEDGATKAMGTTIGDFEKTRSYLAKLFPFVENRIKAYEQIASDSSKNPSITTRLVNVAVGKGVLFYLLAEFDANGLSLQTQLKKIGQVVGALHIATNQIDDYEREHFANLSKLRSYGGR